MTGGYRKLKEETQQQEACKGPSIYDVHAEGREGSGSGVRM